MTQGMVISLEMQEMKWVTADLNQIASVKEQRVDGSSTLRCKVYSSRRESRFMLKIKYDMIKDIIIACPKFKKISKIKYIY
jgi:hypothetical protein